jgi:hypothetical protein
MLFRNILVLKARRIDLLIIYNVIISNITDLRSFDFEFV